MPYLEPSTNNDSGGVSCEVLSGSGTYTVSSSNRNQTIYTFSSGTYIGVCSCSLGSSSLMGYIRCNASATVGINQIVTSSSTGSGATTTSYELNPYYFYVGYSSGSYTSYTGFLFVFIASNSGNITLTFQGSGNKSLSVPISLAMLHFS